jgi:cobalt/nickel transport system permease protein
MNVNLDGYAHLDSPLHRWDPRCKLVGLLVLMFAFAAVRNLWLLPAMLVVTAVFYALSRLPLSFLVARLSYPGGFLLMVAAVIPFVSGQTILAHIGPLALREEGVLLVLLIAGRFLSILTMGIILFGTSPFLTTIRAMYALGLPPVLNDMILFFYRYLHDSARNLATMQTAMRLRGFQATRLNWHTARTLASLAGTLLVRSYEQSQRVYHAMLLRGYGRAPHPREMFHARAGDFIALGGTWVLAATFIIAGGMV